MIILLGLTALIYLFNGSIMNSLVLAALIILINQNQEIIKVRNTHTKK